MPTTTYTDSTFSVSTIGARTDPTGAAVPDLTAEEARLWSQVFAEGYLTPAAAMKVQAQSVPDMTVRVGSGTAKADYYVVSGEVGGQGNYLVRLDATTQTVTIAAADASQPRTDEVYLVVRDSVYDTSGRALPQIGYRKGDVGGAFPGPDAAWRASVLLGRVAVAAAATTITAANVTDLRASSTLVGGLSVTDHGSLTGLADDDHTQYLNTARGDARYFTQAQVNSSLAGKANTAHAHSAADISSGTFSAGRIPSTLNATNISGSLGVSASVSANYVSAASVSTNGDALYATGDTCYIGGITSETAVTSFPVNASQEVAGISFGAAVRCGTMYTGGSSGAINGPSDRSSPWFGTDNNGPYLRLWWNGSNVQFVRGDNNVIVKTFVIDHPDKPANYLVHATTESPQNGVEYWGEAIITGGHATVTLPSYFESLCGPGNRQVQVSVMLPDEDASIPAEPDTEEIVDRVVPVVEIDPKGVKRPGKEKVVKEVRVKRGRPAEPEHLALSQVAASRPVNGKFRIACSGPDGTRVAWLVKAVRKDVPALEAEPLKADNVLQGNGPYTFLTPKPKAS